ncbi:hypothetical protein PV08_07598 [Exophiala spinifera]|uniref:Amino acid permease/ SLC12A domain-containing protein n=1 Tax=Exophiala spinifera TaxID=91928 RepID=A0A0D2B7A4_9EURO|nr:uncharacterized protein PV08_07598 [Exophiala spinifera]KIW14813.1 hypothetical protein PV08_07598 [Exophiala spinifera]
MTAIFSRASVMYHFLGPFSCDYVLFQLVAITYPNFVNEKWHRFLAFEAFNLLAAPFNLCNRFPPGISKTALLFSVTLGLAFFMTLLVAPSAKASAQMVFVKYYNASDWSDGVASFIAINMITWSFSCLDATTHLAEEIPHPVHQHPKALLVTSSLPSSLLS